MGKKRVIKKTEEELLKETETREAAERKTIQKTAQPEQKKGKKGQIDQARVFIQSTYNNTVITMTDQQGRVIAWSSSGSVGFKGPRKATPFAASRVVEALLEKTRNFNIREVDVFIRGVGSGRDAAVRAFINHGLEVNSIKDITPVPHNGCRPPKPRRV